MDGTASRSGLPSPLYVIALTRRGARTAAKLDEALGAGVILPERMGDEVKGARTFSRPVADEIASLWEPGAGFLLVMAAGVAVRSIAPLLKDKKSDPAVVVLDADGRYAVPLLSGHLGGANALALAAAECLGGEAVITTATDTAGKPAAEVWARDCGLVLENPRAVVAINGAWADDEPVNIYADPLLGVYPPCEKLAGHCALVTGDEKMLSTGGAWIAVTPRLIEAHSALVARPKVLALGAGCRREAEVERVCEGITRAVIKAGFSPLSVKLLASVDVKAKEAALLELAASLEVPFVTYTGAELDGVKTPNPSARVAQEVGTASVCEAAALLAAGDGSDLLMEKRSDAVWTAALALTVQGER